MPLSVVSMAELRLEALLQRGRCGVRSLSIVDERCIAVVVSAA
jgi:hypothetical protein